MVRSMYNVIYCIFGSRVAMFCLLFADVFLLISGPWGLLDDLYIILFYFFYFILLLSLLLSLSLSLLLLLLGDYLAFAITWFLRWPGFQKTEIWLSIRTTEKTKKLMQGTPITRTWQKITSQVLAHPPTELEPHALYHFWKNKTKKLTQGTPIIWTHQK